MDIAFDCISLEEIFTRPPLHNAQKIFPLNVPMALTKKKKGKSPQSHGEKKVETQTAIKKTPKRKRLKSQREKNDGTSKKKRRLSQGQLKDGMLKKKMKISKSTSSRKLSLTKVVGTEVQEKKPDERELLMELNKQKDKHRADFKARMKLECSLPSTGVGKKKMYFGKKRYEETVAYLQRKREQETPEIEVWNNLDQYKLDPKDDTKLLRPSKAMSDSVNGAMAKLNYNEMKDSDWVPVLRADTDEAFENIYKLHWRKEPYSHLGATRLSNQLSEEFGQNYPFSVCTFFNQTCPVCKVLIEKKKKNVNLKNVMNEVHGVSSQGNVLFSVIDINGMADRYADTHPHKTLNLDGFEYMLLITYFKQREYFDLSLLMSNDLDTLGHYITQLFNIVGFPESIQYVAYDDFGVKFSSTGSDGKRVKIRSDDLCEEVLGFLAKRQTGEGGCVIPGSEPEVPEVYRRAIKFLIEFHSHRLNEDGANSFTPYKWLSFVSTFLNDDKTFTQHRRSKNLRSSRKASVIYGNFCEYINELKETLLEKEKNSEDDEDSDEEEDERVDEESDEEQEEQDKVLEKKEEDVPGGSTTDDDQLRDTDEEKSNDDEKPWTLQQVGGSSDSDDDASQEIQLHQIREIEQAENDEENNGAKVEGENINETPATLVAENVNKTPATVQANEMEETPMTKTLADIIQDDFIYTPPAKTQSVKSPAKKKSSNKNHLPKGSIESFFVMQTARANGRSLVSEHSSVTKLGTIINKPRNQCYAISVFQFLLGISEFWVSIKKRSITDMETTISRLIQQKPFTASSLIMGSLLRHAVSKTFKPVSMDVLRRCRITQIQAFSSEGQEDASEYMGFLIDALINENSDEDENVSGGHVCSTLKPTYVHSRTCLKCDHRFKDEIVKETYYHLCIPEALSSKNKTDMQTLVSGTFDSTVEVESGGCPNCEANTQTPIQEKTKITKSTNDVIFVVKRYNNNGTKNSINIDCRGALKLPVYSDDEKHWENYFLRAVVCHYGATYNEGHYYTYFVETVVENNESKTTYHELSDDKHHVLTEDEFHRTLASNGYIFHFSKRQSGSLVKNNYGCHSVDNSNIKEMKKSFMSHWREKNPDRDKRQSRMSRNDFVLKNCGQLSQANSNDAKFGEFFKGVSQHNDPFDSHYWCLNHSQTMCVNWNTSCQNCKKRFPTVARSRELCFVKNSNLIGQKGLFAKTALPSKTYICMYSGKPVKKGTQGKYVVSFDNIVLDGKHSKSDAKYSNHSCEPNCVLQKVSKDLTMEKVSPFGNEEFETKLWLKTIRKIKQGEELMYHYGDAFNFEKGCKCGKCPTLICD